MVHAEEPILTETIQAGNLHVSQRSLGLMKRAADSQIRQSGQSLGLVILFLLLGIITTLAALLAPAPNQQMSNLHPILCYESVIML